MKKGWQKTARLGDLFMTAAGGTPLTTKREYYEGGTIPWLNSGEVRQGVVHSARTFITELGLRNSNAKIFPKDTVLVALYGATAAQVGILAIEAATNQAVFGIYPNSSFLPKFIFYFLLSCHQDLSGLKFKDLQVPLAPLPEQQRIVGVLDEAFASLATAQAHAAQNLQNARELFESHLNAVFTQRSEGWVDKTMEEVAASDCSLSYGIVQPGEEVEDGLPVVRPTDLIRTKIGLDGLKRIDPKLAESYQRTSLQGGELLLCVRGSTGVISMAAPELKGANVTRGIVPIRLNSMLLSQDFGFHLLRAEPVQTQIRAKTYGAALMQINIGDLRKIAVAVPALNEQRAIATQLDALAAETQRLTRIYEQKLVALAELKKSLLHQAFSGEL
jgi:type I restriction enzyme S subunit